MSSELIEYDAACRAIAVCVELDEILEWKNKADALLAYAKQAKNAKLVKQCQTIKARAMVRMGELSLELPKAVVEGKSGNVRRPTGGTSLGKRETLADAGISKTVANRAEQLAAAPEAVKQALVDGKINIKQAVRQATAEKRQAEVAAAVATTDREGDRYQLHHADFRTVELPQFDWIVTDPPYPREYLSLYEDLGATAKRVLKPGASLLCMVGQSYLPEVIAALAKNLTYHWTLAYLTPGGQAVQLFQRNVNTFWKPVLWFVNGEYSGGWIGDVVKSKTNDNDKVRHGWGQSESGMHDLMTRFIKPGQSVFDPFMGAGTTGLVALGLGASFVGCDIEKKSFDETKVRLAT